MVVALAVAAVILISSGTGRQDVAGGQGPQETGAQEPSPQVTDDPENTVDEEAPPENEAGPDGELGSPTLGSEDAPVVLLEYSDYQ